MSAKRLARQSQSLLTRFNKIRKETRGAVDSSRHTLLLDANDASLAAYIIQAFEDSGAQLPRGEHAKGLTNVTRPFIQFHADHPAANWDVEWETPDRLIIRAPSFHSLNNWKKRTLPKYFQQFAPKGRATDASHLGFQREVEQSPGIVSVSRLLAQAEQSKTGLTLASVLRNTVDEVVIQAADEIQVTKAGKLRKDASFNISYGLGALSTPFTEPDMSRITKALGDFLEEVATDEEFAESILDIVEDKFLHQEVIRAKHKKYKERMRSRKRRRVKTQTYKALGGKKKEDELKPAQVRNYLNQRIHSIISQRMSEPALVYRTGRFAASAQVLKVTRSKAKDKVFNVHYTYMTQPYQVFEMGSGSRLATPQRDPRSIIGGALREAAQEINLRKFGLIRSR